MNDINVTNVLAQIRALQARTAPQLPAATAVQAPEGGFAGLLKASIERVSQSQAEVSGLQQAFAAGDRDTDLSTVMIAGAKAQVQFRAMVEVRNRLVNAYQEIMNMPI